MLEAGVMISGVAGTLASYSPSTVGGLFAIGAIDARGVGWRTYSIGGLELKVENGGFVQYDHANNRRVPLKTLLEYDAGMPEGGNLIFERPQM